MWMLSRSVVLISCQFVENGRFEKIAKNCAKQINQHTQPAAPHRHQVSITMFCIVFQQMGRTSRFLAMTVAFIEYIYIWIYLYYYHMSVQ